MRVLIPQWRSVLCLSAALLGSMLPTLAEPAWLCPSYQIVEVTRLHYGAGQPTPEIFPYPHGLGANSQVIYNTQTGGPVRYRLWQPLPQFGRPAGSSILAEGVYYSFAGPIGTGVTSDGRFAEAHTGANGGNELRWWDGLQWISLIDEDAGQPQSRSPNWVQGVNDRGDIAFNYVLRVNFGLPGGATNLSRAGLWSGNAQNWLPIFPEDTTRAYVLSMNANGLACGVYRANNAPAGTAYRGFTATYGTTPIDFAPVGNLPGYSQTHGINDAGEIVGVTGTQGGGVRPFIYLPTAAHGLSSGLHEIGPTMAGYTGSGGSPSPITARIFLNNRGQALLTPSWSPSFFAASATNGFLWQRGQSWPLAQLADTSGYLARFAGDSPWYADYTTDAQTGAAMALHAPRGFNDRGEILLGVAMASFVSASDFDHVVLLFRPKLTASLALDKEKIAPGTTNKVRLRLHNAFTSPLPAPSAPELHWDGPGTPQILNGPTLASTNASWSPGLTNEWVWTFRFTNETTGIFVAQGSAGTNNSMLGESAVLKVLDQADLWVRRTNDVAWKGDDNYAEVVLASQTREAAIQPTETAAFNVRVQNDGERERELTVQAVASGDPGWLVTYKQGATDVGMLITGAGLNVGTLASGDYVDLTVTLRGTNALDSGSRREIVFTGKALGATNGSDVVKVAAEVLNEVIVNSTADLPDASITDGVPDVNTNAPGLQTTLRCAIDFANRREGVDKIKFEIPAIEGKWVDGVPQIEPESALPEITETVVIDGWTQNTNSLTPPIALSGKRLPRPPRPTSPSFYYFWPGAIPALVVKGEACELRGLVINHFPTGLELAGSGSHVVEGCFFGLNADATVSYGNGVDGGGTHSAMRDPDGHATITTGGEYGYEYTPSFYDDRYVMWIFTGASGILRPQLRARGWDVRVTSPQNRLGGASARQRNRFGSLANFIEGVTQPQSGSRGSVEIVELPLMIWIDGEAAFANTVLGSTFGVKANESEALVEDSDSFVLPPNSDHAEALTNVHSRTFSPALLITDAPGTMIGGSSGGGNLFALGSGIELTGTNCIGTSFFGNFFGVSRNGSQSLHRLYRGISAADCGFVQIGGLNAGEPNRFVTKLRAISLVNLFGQPSRILGNIIGHSGTANCNSPDTLVQIANSAQTEVRGNTFSGYRVSALSIYSENSTLPDATVSVVDNTFIHDRDQTVNTTGIPINIGGGRGHTLIGNRFTGPSDERMIVLANKPLFKFGPDSFGAPIPPLPNDDFDLDGGPNNLQNWPMVATALLTNGQLRVQAGVDTGILSGQYSIHVYRCFSDQWYHGQPQELVASGLGTADASGRAAFIATVPVGSVTEGDFLCATATGPDGSTSEVGPVRRVIGGPDVEADGMGDATENRVPNRTPPPVPGGPQQGPGFGDGNGDNVSDAQQANVTSFPVAANQWLTLVAPGGISFNNVDSTAMPSPTDVLAGFSFPLGFVTFTLNGFTPGATVSVTNILHGSATISNVFAFGPTLANPQPHWYELNFARAGDELRLSFTDGAAGDHDLSANGSITALYAPAYQLPPVPQLSLLSFNSETVPATFVEYTGTNTVLSTNLVRLTRSALAWPAASTNYLVEYAPSLSSPLWLPLLNEAVIIGDKLVVTNVSVDPMRFYRLRPGFVTLAQVTAPKLNIQRTSTNTFLLSWLASFTGFALQQNTNLVSGTWTSVTNSVIVTNSQNQVIVAPATGSRFFRLISQ